MREIRVAKNMKSTKAIGLSELARKQGVTRQAVFNRAERQRRLAAGLCPVCGHEKRDWNPKKGKPYSLGPKCRKAYNRRLKAYMQRRTQAKRGKKRQPLF